MSSSYHILYVKQQLTIYLSVCLSVISSALQPHCDVHKLHSWTISKENTIKGIVTYFGIILFVFLNSYISKWTHLKRTSNKKNDNMPSDLHPKENKQIVNIYVVWEKTCITHPVLLNQVIMQRWFHLK